MGDHVGAGLHSTVAADVPVNPLQPIAFEQVCTCSVRLAIQ